MFGKSRTAVGVALAAGLVLTTAGRGQAATITADSSVSFSGGWLPMGGTGVADATGVDVIDEVAFVSCALTSSCTGDYADITGIVTATYHDFSFNPLGPPAGGPVSPLWTFEFGSKTYSFDLVTVSVDKQTKRVLALSGTGTLFITGLEPTFGSWSFSGDTSGGGVFAFSSTSTAVPDGGSTMALLGLSLLGVAALRRNVIG